MNARMLGALLGAEARMTIRDTAGLIVPLVLPLLLLLVQGMQPMVRQAATRSGHTVLEVFLLPSTVAMVAAMIAVVNMPSFMATYRRTGVLRTLAVTPIRPAVILAAQVLVSFAQLVLGIAVMLLVAIVALGVRLPEHPFVALGVATLGATALFGLGMLVAAVAPSPNAAVAIGLVTFLATGAVGGMFGPTDAYPPFLAAIGEALPFGAMVQGLQAAWVGQPVPGSTLLAFAVTSVVGAVVAVWVFRAR